MESNVRGIIWALNAAVAVLATMLCISKGYADIYGWRLALIALAGFFSIHYGLIAVEGFILRRGKNEKDRTRKTDTNSVPGKPWYENRFSVAEQKNRHSRENTKAI